MTFTTIAVKESHFGVKIPMQLINAGAKSMFNNFLLLLKETQKQ